MPWLLSVSGLQIPALVLMTQPPALPSGDTQPTTTTDGSTAAPVASPDETNAESDDATIWEGSVDETDEDDVAEGVNEDEVLEELEDEIREPRLNTLRGPSGLFYTSTPDVGGKYTFRFGIHTSMFKKDTFAVNHQQFGSDTHTRIMNNVNLGFTFADWGELYLSLNNQANRNERDDPYREDPEVVLAMGDVDFGIKAVRPIGDRGVSVGAQIGGGLLSSSQQVLPETFNFNIDAVIGADLRQLTESRLPVRLTANVGYLRDKSMNMLPSQIEDLTSREILRFAMGLNHSRARTRFAIDFPLEVGSKNVLFNPIIEYSWDISVQQEEDLFGELKEFSEADSFMPRSQSWLTVGARANVYDGLMLSAAADIRTVFPEYDWGPPVAPWQAILGIGWAFDPARTKPAEIIDAPPVVQPTPQLDGRIQGQVVDTNGSSVAGARVSFPGIVANVILTDANGGFTSFRFPEGDVTVLVEIDGLAPIEQSVTVITGEDTQLKIDVPAPPPAPTGGIFDGTITNSTGAGLAATVHITGMGIDQPFQSDESGRIAIELPVGEYTAIVSAPGHAPQTAPFTVTGEGYILQTTLVAGAADAPGDSAAQNPYPLVVANKRRIRLRKKVTYKTSNNVSDRSLATLDQLAQFLTANPQYALIEIRVHTDDRGNPTKRSSTRAKAVQTYLVQKGIDIARLKAVGYGDKSPIDVNITDAGRRKNNRTELRVKTYSGQ